MTTGTSLTYKYLNNYLDAIRAKGRFAFTLEEVKDEFRTYSDKAVLQSLFRLKQKKRIVQIRKGFYTILPPEYSAQGALPVTFFVDDLMQSLQKDYYIGVLSAAALHGASHQQTMETFIITKKPALRDIKNDTLKINFLVKNEWDLEYIHQLKTDAGYVKVSSPELTALDLLYYVERLGINRVFTILEELSEVMKPNKLMKTAKTYTQLAAIQRLGFLLDNELGQNSLAASLYAFVKDKKGNNIPLVPGLPKEGGVNNKWRIIKNEKIESDL